jgi:hypothetical protein
MLLKRLSAHVSSRQPVRSGSVDDLCMESFSCPSIATLQGERLSLQSSGVSNTVDMSEVFFQGVTQDGFWGRVLPHQPG